ncbi:MAG: glycosyltransferase [Coprothermobacter proteolyticus]
MRTDSFLVIIPAFNEEKNIGRVLKPLREENLPVLVVDDGSTDRTAWVASDERVLLIVFPRNRGKSAAVKEALRFNVDKVVLLDADLTGLTHNHALQIKQWISTYNCARIILKGGRAATTWSHMISPVLAGQRILPMAVLRKFYESSSVTGFQLEVALEDFLKKEGIRQEELVLEGVGQIMKEEKRGFWPGLKARLRMYLDILAYKLRGRPTI